MSHHEFYKDLQAKLSIRAANENEEPISTTAASSVTSSRDSNKNVQSSAAVAAAAASILSSIYSPFSRNNNNNSNAYSNQAVLSKQNRSEDIPNGKKKIFFSIFLTYNF